MKTKIFVDVNRTKNATCVILNDKDDIEECVFSRDDKKSIKSNIYLATVWRVEHSLQAAFVQYGGDKAGFLPFKRIHPDYYQLPISEKEAIKKEINAKIALKKQDVSEESESDDSDKSEDYEDFAKEYYELVYNRYNIQEVIKKGQKMLVQVFKDERGNKGVSLTTYISIAGRCAVFMPNNPGGIGISRKISKYDVRKRIHNIVKNFQIQDGSSLIIRTLGAQSGIDDFKKDYNYLQNIWEKIKKDAIGSEKIPIMVYQELDIIKQTIRDNYSQDVSSILINNKDYFSEITDFMKELIPGEEKKIRLYNDPVPMFDRYNVNKKIQALLSPRVDLDSGGYLIINPTEALTSIDINSGKATSEKNIEETALQINVEATFEIAKQLRLRGIGGLIVVDYIDMMDQKNKKKLEDALRNAFADDKAKVQFTKPSIFGLVEISRQRLRSNITEILEKTCVYCSGVGCVKRESIVAEALIKRLYDFVGEKKIGTKMKADHIHVMASEESIDYINEFLIHDIKTIERISKAKLLFRTFIQHESDFISISIENKDSNSNKFKTFDLNLFDVERKNRSIKAKFATVVKKFSNSLISFLEK